MRRRAAVVLLLSVLPGQSQEIYDLVLRGGHVIDPKNGHNGQLDIAVTSGKIVRIGSGIPPAQARQVIDATGYYVTPGLIDLHAYLGNTRHGVVPDHNTLRFGVTTVVDGGSAGLDNFEQFRKSVIAPATVRVLAFLAVDGDADRVRPLLSKYPQILVGVTPAARPDSVQQTVQAAAASKTIVMADTAPGARQLRPGDIATHVYGRNSLRIEDLQAARRKGVLFDVGHGGAGLWFRVAVPAVKQAFLPDIISTGMDRDSILLPRTTMTGVMSRFLAMGLTLHQVIERTTANPAKAIQRPDIGSLETGGVADIAVFELRKGQFGFLDSGHARLNTDRELRCVLTIRDGKVVWDTEGLSLTDWKNAGPYSNFK